MARQQVRISDNWIHEGSCDRLCRSAKTTYLSFCCIKSLFLWVLIRIGTTGPEIHDILGGGSRDFLYTGRLVFLFLLPLLSIVSFVGMVFLFLFFVFGRGRGGSIIA